MLTVLELRPDALLVLQEEFNVQPSDVEVAEGEVAVFSCGPPTGRPEPNVLWKKDGVPINITDPHFTVSTRGSKSNPLLVLLLIVFLWWEREVAIKGLWVCPMTASVSVPGSRD